MKDANALMTRILAIVGIGQREAARRLDWPQNTVNRLCAGKGGFPYIATAHISKRLGISEDALIGLYRECWKRPRRA